MLKGGEKMIDGDNKVERVAAFMCNLTSEYGDSPTEEQAESFARREKTIISPSEAIEILGVNKWEDVVAFYRKETLRAGSGINLRKSGQESHARRYSDDELLDILVTLWREYDGMITQDRINKRSRLKPTPSWLTLKKRLGKPETWASLVEKRLLQRKTQNPN